jgi:hypothetical protein
MILRRSLEKRVISICLNKPNIHYVKHNNSNCTKHDININSKTHFHELRNTVYLCLLPPNYDSECEKYSRINLLRSNTHDTTRKKIRVFYKQNRWKMILRPFVWETCYWFRFVWTSTTFTTSNNDFNGTKHMILPFTHKTYFHVLGISL